MKMAAMVRTNFMGLLWLGDNTYIYNKFGRTREAVKLKSTGLSFGRVLGRQGREAAQVSQRGKKARPSGDD